MFYESLGHNTPITEVYDYDEDRPNHPHNPANTDQRQPGTGADYSPFSSPPTDIVITDEGTLIQPADLT